MHVNATFDIQKNNAFDFHIIVTIIFIVENMQTV